MKKKFTLLKYFSLLSLAVVSSMCTMDEVLEDRYSPSLSYGGNDMVPININVSVDDADEAGTRAVATLNAAVFSEPYQNASIWYKRFNSSDVEESESFTANNTFVASYESSTNKLTPSTPIYFMPGGKTVKVYGWYPANNGNTEFTVANNQTTNPNYLLSDLMLANEADCTRELNGSNEWVVTNAALTFRHVMSKVILNVTRQSGVTVNTITLKNVKPTVNISTANTSSLSITTDNTAEAIDVVVYSSEVQDAPSLDAAIAGIIPPQTIAAGTFLVVNATQGCNTGNITYNLSVAKEFAGSTNYTVNINVDASLIGQTVTVGDWTSTGALTLPVANQIEVTSNASQVISRGGSISAIGIGNVRGDFSVTEEVPTGDSPSGITVETTGSALTRSLQFTIPNNTPSGVYNFQAIDAGTTQYSASTATITIAVSGELTAIETSLGTVNTNLTSIITKLDALYSTNNNILSKLNELYWLLATNNDEPINLTLAYVKAHPSSKYIGMVIGANGSVYVDQNAATAAGTTPMAIIAYLDLANSSSPEASNASYRGLAMALTTASDTKPMWDSRGGSATHCIDDSDITAWNATTKGILNGYERTQELLTGDNHGDGDGQHTHPAALQVQEFRASHKITGATVSDWFLPTIGQINLMLNAVTGLEALRWESYRNEHKAANLDALMPNLTTKWSTALHCWSSVEFIASNAWYFDAYNGYVDDYRKSRTNIAVRPFFAF